MPLSCPVNLINASIATGASDTQAFARFDEQLNSFPPNGVPAEGCASSTVQEPRLHSGPPLLQRPTDLDTLREGGEPTQCDVTALKGDYLLSFSPSSIEEMFPDTPPATAPTNATAAVTTSDCNSACSDSDVIEVTSVRSVTPTCIDADSNTSTSQVVDLTVSSVHIDTSPDVVALDDLESPSSPVVVGDDVIDITSPTLAARPLKRKRLEHVADSSLSDQKTIAVDDPSPESSDIDDLPVMDFVRKAGAAKARRRPEESSPVVATSSMTGPDIGQAFNFDFPIPTSVHHHHQQQQQQQQFQQQQQQQRTGAQAMYYLQPYGTAPEQAHQQQQLFQQQRPVRSQHHTEARTPQDKARLTQQQQMNAAPIMSSDHSTVQQSGALSRPSASHPQQQQQQQLSLPHSHRTTTAVDDGGGGGGGGSGGVQRTAMVYPQQAHGRGQTADELPEQPDKQSAYDSQTGQLSRAEVATGVQQQQAARRQISSTTSSSTVHAEAEMSRMSSLSTVRAPQPYQQHQQQKQQPKQRPSLSQLSSAGRIYDHSQQRGAGVTRVQAPSTGQQQQQAMAIMASHRQQQPKTHGGHDGSLDSAFYSHARRTPSAQQMQKQQQQQQ
eukprot:scpid45304/ scgid0670/ 